MRSFRALVVLVLLLATGVAEAQPAEPPQAAKDFLAVAQWLGAKAPPPCTERCFVLTKLSLDGSVAAGSLGFTLEGAVLADHPVAVPLFGPPNKVRLDAVTDDGKPAHVGFEGDHYFVVTSNKRFTIKGKISLDGDLALTIPGPLNTLEANLTAGRVVEGQKLSGLSATTIHFDGGITDAQKPTEPTVFQLSRAYRVLRETGFEYRLVLRSGSDLGVVRLPLAFGEKVLDVSGSTGWKVEGTELVLPTAGHNASITITGSIAEAPKHLVADPRSSYEWWLLESDAEHRVNTSTGAAMAKQVDSAESPIARTQPSSRLFLAQRGEALDLTVQTLSASDALAAVVREHTRTLVLTARGDWVVDEQLVYENNGVDHLMFKPAGRPIFLATDGVGERLLHKDGALSEVVVGLRKGTHTARLQSLSQTKVGPFFGALTVPVPEHALTASRATMHLGLPRDVHPIAVLGGDRPVWLIGFEELAGIAVSLLAAWFLATSRRDRALVTIGLAGLWLVVPPVFVATVVSLLAFAGFRIGARVFAPGSWKVLRVAMVPAALVLVVFLAMASVGRKADAPRFANTDTTKLETANIPASADVSYKVKAGEVDGKFGNWEGQLATAGILPGVTPVALPLPSAERWVDSSRELVTCERPFAPRLIYVTTLGLLPFVAGWAAAILALAWLHRAALVSLRDRIRALLAPPAQPAPTPAE